MAAPSLLDLYCGAGGCTWGYKLAGFDVVGVDHRPQRHYRGGTFMQADALEYVREHGHEYDAIHASPPCQAHSTLRRLQKGREYPDLIPATRAALAAAGKPYVIENVPGAPLGGGDTYVLVLCGTMFGLVTPDGRAEIRRHRLFETNWCFGLRPACQHGLASFAVTGTGSAVAGARKVLTVVGHTPVDNTGRRTICVAGGKAMSGGMYEQQAVLKLRALAVAGHGARAWNSRRAMSVTGHKAQTNVERNTVRETFTADDARAAMGIDWMPMSALSQAIPPAYTHWIGLRLLRHLEAA